MLAGKKHWGRILLLLLFLAALGCSDSALFEDYGFDYQVTLCVCDDGSGSECTHTVDILQVMCSATEAEEYYDAEGIVTFNVESGMRKVKFTSFTVDYIPEETSASGDGSGSVFTPPNLPRYHDVLDTEWISPGSEVTFSFIILDISRKLDIRTLAAAEGHGTVDDPWQHTYTLRVTLDGIDELEERFSVRVDAHIIASNYDRCS